MRLIGLAAVLTLSLILALLTAEARARTPAKIRPSLRNRQTCLRKIPAEWSEGSAKFGSRAELVRRWP
jgi:hypothetical protein